jgi:hypothetical protein
MMGAWAAAAAQPALYRGHPGRRLVVLVGSQRALARAVRTQGVGRRHTALAERLRDRDGMTGGRELPPALVAAECLR